MVFNVSKTVAFFLSDLQNGGTEWFAIHLARSLKTRGYEPQFLLSNQSGDLVPEVIHEIPLTSLNGGHYTPLGILRCLPKLMHILRTAPPDALICGLPLINAVAGIAKFLTHAKTKLIVVEHVRLCRKATHTCWAKHHLKALMIWATHRLADMIICVSHVVAADLSELYATASVSNLKVIYNPVIPANFEDLCNASVHHSWCEPAQKNHGPLLLSIGRLLENKDYPTLLSAFQEVLETNPNARLIILGEGEERPVLEKRIQDLNLADSVSMPGAVPNIFPYLKAASLFVLPSRSEAFGNVVVEALACGLPVVSTDCGGPREILEDGKYGQLVPIGDAHAMAKAIRTGLLTQVDKEHLRQRGRTFSVETATDAYLHLINQGA